MRRLLSVGRKAPLLFPGAQELRKCRGSVREEGADRKSPEQAFQIVGESWKGFGRSGNWFTAPTARPSGGSPSLSLSPLVSSLSLSPLSPSLSPSIFPFPLLTLSLLSLSSSASLPPLSPLLSRSRSVSNLFVPSRSFSITPGSFSAPEARLRTGGPGGSDAVTGGTGKGSTEGER